jgi:uncharacterized protein (TIGR02246 family)
MTYASVEAAEAAFYRSFEEGRLGAMLEVWATDDDILCVHPVGPALKGRAEIAAGWRGILSGSKRMRFRVEVITRFHSETLAVHIVHEYITVEGEGTEHPPVVATNIYRHSNDGWRMVEHHASPTQLTQPRANASPVIH